jgi:hypothetical protein
VKEDGERGNFPIKRSIRSKIFFARRIMESGSEDGELPRRRRVSESHAGDGEPQREGSVPPERIEDGANEIQVAHRRAEAIADEENERA